MARVNLKGVTWEHPRGYDSIVAASSAYAALGRAAIEWTPRPLQAFADQPIEELAAAYDLIVLDHPHTGNAAAEGLLAPLDGAGHDAALATLARQSIGKSHESYQFSGRQWALALDAAAQVSAYRADRLAKSDTPRTWTAVLELAAREPVIWPIKPVDSFMSFFTLMANVGAPCGSSEIFFEREAARHVLDAMLRLRELIDDACLAMNPINALDLMAGGDRYVYAPLLFGYSNYARPGFRHHLVRFADIPALGSEGPRGAILGGTGIAVSSRSDHIGEAIDFAFWACAAEQQKGVFFAGGGQPANAVAWSDPAVNAACNDFFMDTRETLDRSYLRPRYNGFMHLQDKGGDAVHAFLMRRRDARETLADLEAIHAASLVGMHG